MATTTMLLLLLAAMASSAAFAQSKGTYERIQVFGPSLEGNLRGQTDSPEVSVYLPPSYAEESERRYPVVYLLHGYSGTDESWFGESAFWDGRGAADRAISAGSAEMIVVMPNCNNAFGGCTRRPAIGKTTSPP